MAYAEPPRNGVGQRPQYEHQQTSYSTMQQSYTAEYGFAPTDQGPRFNFGDRPGLPQHYSDACGPNGQGLGYDHDKWRGVGRGGHGEIYRAKKHNDGGGHPIQQTQQIPVPAGRAYSDPRTRGQPRSRSRPPERHRPEAANAPYQALNRRGDQEYQQQYQSEYNLQNGSPAQPGGGNEYNDSIHRYHNGWKADQQYRPPADKNQDHHNPSKRAEIQGQGLADQSYGQHQENNAIVSVVQKFHQPPRPSHGQPHSISSKSETLLRSKASGKKVVQTPISHDAVAWDNPFPTFPMRPKKGVQSSSRSLDGSAVEVSLEDEYGRDNSNNSRPQTAGSKSSSFTIPLSQSIDETVSKPHHYHDVYSNSEARNQRRADPDAFQEKSRTGRDGNAGARSNQLKPLPANGRHLEDNRMRPSISNDIPVNIGYERSRTMPTAVSEATAKTNNRPRPPIQTNWQEPGPVAGYYGPEDRGYTPNSPVDPTQRRPWEPPRGKPGEKRPYRHGAIQNAGAHYQGQCLGHSLTPQDSIGDVFDDYYDTPHPQDHQPYGNTDHNQHRLHIDKEMPWFHDVAPDTGSNQRRRPILDKHLQTEQNNNVDGGQDSQNDTHLKEQVPRSRSQPNLKDWRSPRQQQDDGFDFGVPRPPTRPPATAPAPGEYHGNAYGSIRFPNLNSSFGGREQHPRQQEYRSSGPAAAHHTDHRNVPTPTTGSLPVAYQVEAGPEPYRFPPLQNGQYRSEPTKVSGRLSPKHDPGNSAFAAIPRQYNGHSPSSQDVRPHDGLIKPPGGRALAVNTKGALQPPIRLPINPDELPSHPAPVRAGFMEGLPVNQSQKPAPIRQYDAVPSSMQLPEPLQKPVPSNLPQGKRDSLPVSHQELDKLKQVTARNPNDLAMQLVLAKKMIEAAFVLVDERADPRTRSKSREKYIMDAHKIVKKLSGNGYTEAIFYLADCYTRGALGLESDTREAFKLYQNAAKAGHAQAAYRVAVCCEIGQEEGGGTSRDAVKAMQWYRRAATLGDTPAMYKMGIISLKGLLGQPRNPREAIVWLKRAAERADVENPHALHELALLHEKPNGNDGVSNDQAYSNQLFTQAANLGYKFSQYRLGSAYEYGLMGCPVDPRQSIAWYSKAAVQEEHQSELALSGWYLTGSDGILQQSDTEAYLWARKAALAGLAKAEYAMGYFTEVGIGAPANVEDAKRWYWKAASQNFPKARDRLEDLRRGGPTKRKERVSRSNMRKSSEGECIVM